MIIMVICVFGASSNDIDNIFLEQTELLSEKLAKRGHSLIFGGGKNGLMGAAVRGFVKGGAKTVGVAPEFFKPANVIYENCDEFVWTENMRDRKKYMEDNADAFIVTPGGIGTYEEFFEVLTLKHLGQHKKPIAIFNVGGFFDKLIAVIEDNIEDGFVKENIPEMYKLSADIDEVIKYVENDDFDMGEVKFYG